MTEITKCIFFLHQQTHCRYDGFQVYQFIVSVILQPFVRKKIELRHCVSKIKNNIKKHKGRTSKYKLSFKFRQEHNWFHATYIFDHYSMNLKWHCPFFRWKKYIETSSETFIFCFLHIIIQEMKYITLVMRTNVQFIFNHTDINPYRLIYCADCKKWLYTDFLLKKQMYL